MFGHTDLTELVKIGPSLESPPQKKMARIKPVWPENFDGEEVFFPTTIRKKAIQKNVSFYKKQRICRNTMTSKAKALALGQ